MLKYPKNLNTNSYSTMARVPKSYNGGYSTNQSNEDSQSKNGVNVRVILRCRPMSALEKKDSTNFQVVKTKVETKEVSISQTVPGRKIDSISKTFTFDGVCSQYTTQAELFKLHIVPIVDEVLLGFNCTIFAYGQTGTGKTYTMEGDLFTNSLAKIENSPSFSLPLTDPSTCRELTEYAGIIPRAVQHIFKKLEAQETEYTVRVSYLEIYNEELNDLLNDGEKQNLRIYEDTASKKGLSVDRLEELSVNNPQDIYNILCLAVKKRRTAETILNRQSSRSHCIFSVTIHMKESNLNGEDVIKIGKLNLVDLAGSENIQRSGANVFKDRTKEAGMINQSLLTLGRVINALVERSSYIPYRDSKLTRLLQESLGGRTKTCIVATISPSSLCLEETISTLDYAFRAKNIRNRPEVNQKLAKRVMIREMNHEIERLKQELLCNREKNGVYLPLDRYNNLETLVENQANELNLLQTELTKEKQEKSQLRTQLDELKSQYETKAEELSKHFEKEKILKEKMENVIKERDSFEKNYEQCQQRTRRIETQVVYLMENLRKTGFHFDSIRSNLIECQKMGSQIILHLDEYIQSILEKLKQESRDKLHGACEEFFKKYEIIDSSFHTLFNDNQNKLDNKMKDELQLCLTHVQQIRDEMLQTLSCHSSDYLETLKGSFISMLTDYTNKTTCHLDLLNKNMNSTFNTIDMFLTNICGSIEGFHKQLYNSWTEYRTKTFHGIEEHQKILSTANDTILCQLKDVKNKNDDIYSVHSQIIKDQRNLLENELLQFVKQIEATSQSLLSRYDSQCSEKQKRLNNLQNGVKTNISCAEKMLKTTKTVEEFLESTCQCVDTETKQWMKQTNHFFDKTVADFTLTKTCVEENEKIAKNHYNILCEQVHHIQTTNYPNLVETTMESLQNQITLLKNQTYALHDQINTLETARVSSVSTLLQEQIQAFKSSQEKEIQIRTNWRQNNSEMYTTICDAVTDYHTESKNVQNQAENIFQTNIVTDSFCLKNVLDALPFQEDMTDETNDTNPCLLFSNGVSKSYLTSKETQSANENKSFNYVTASKIKSHEKDFFTTPISTQSRLKGTPRLRSRSTSTPKATKILRTKAFHKQVSPHQMNSVLPILDRDSQHIHSSTPHETNLNSNNFSSTQPLPRTSSTDLFEQPTPTIYSNKPS